jgi:hypothetical protein
VRDVRTGPAAKTPKDGTKLRELVNVSNGDLEDKTITVVHGTDFTNTYFENFCTPKPEVAKVG